MAGDIRLWLEEKFNPFALLLNEKHARANYRLQVTKQDENHTYLDVNPKPRKSSGGWLEMRIDMQRGRAVFMNKDAEGVPKDMPRQLWYEGATHNSFTFDIRRWKGNAADGPKAEEFTRPEDRPGWVVGGWLSSTRMEGGVGNAPLCGVICVPLRLRKEAGCSQPSLRSPLVLPPRTSAPKMASANGA